MLPIKIKLEVKDTIEELLLVFIFFITVAVVAYHATEEPPVKKWNGPTPIYEFWLVPKK